ncbi:XRE family transcriptional regulator [Rhizobium mongolense]|uniref:Phage repressor protein C with HTH and peptisase S24 domain n=1 Tax=Rhizobium mongolense TaxID=57676 RepID=A0A7W6RSD3_9HYPH|nr:LexA family transcriptional regulator [Rhizobium mongolense]MBB4277050.1 phage repressor protein C with HTH and peptisase S24 domain [Rhizobium mongolense]
MSCSRNVMERENAEDFPSRQQKTFPLTQFGVADRIPHMSETLHDRIRKRLEALDLTPSAASLKAGLSKEMLRKLLDNPDAMPSGKSLTALASALEVTEQWLLTGDESPLAVRTDVRPASSSAPLRHEMPNDVPVRGTAAGSHLRGAFQITSDTIDFVRRPPALMNAVNLYSLYIEGSSMEPQYFPGDLIFVHPDKPPRHGDAVVVQCQVDSEGHMEATIGILSRRSADKVTIRKHNPAAEIEIPRDTVISVHKVLSNNELFGI